jgi:DHA1 family multidrug resistance protein-like MFS transporter
MPRFDDIGLSRQGRHVLIWMCVLIAANQFGFGSIVPVIALYAEDFGVTRPAIGLTIAVYGAARFLINLPAGRLADLIGRRLTLALGGSITVIGTVLCAISTNYQMFLGARFIAGAGAALVMTAGQVVLADIASPHNRGRVMAIYQGVFLFAVGAGAFPGGWLADRYGLAAPFWANAAFAALVTILAFVFVPETRDFRPRTKAVGANGVSLSFRQQIDLIWRVPGFALICLTSFAAFFARTGGLFNVIPLLAEDEIGLSPDQIGLGIGMISIVGLVLVYPSGALVDRYGRKAVIVPSMLFSGVAMMLFGTIGSFLGFLLCCMLWSASSGISGAAPAAYATDIAPAGMVAPSLGLYRALADAGYVVGPLLLGAIADLKSPVASLMFTAVFLLACGALFALRAPESMPAVRKE